LKLGFCCGKLKQGELHYESNIKGLNFVQ